MLCNIDLQTAKWTLTKPKGTKSSNLPFDLLRKIYNYFFFQNKSKEEYLTDVEIGKIFIQIKSIGVTKNQSNWFKVGNILQ